MDTSLYPTMSSRVKDIRGQRFSRLTIVQYAGRCRRDSLWLCSCDCGSDVKVTGSNLRSGNRKSCGCLKKEINGATHITHGMSKTKIYRRWRSMLSRCSHSGTNGYKWYGGLGISVCERWRNSFEDFLSDVGMPPSPSHTIDRIDVKGNYEPGNVRWATAKEQAKNKSNTRHISYHGQTLTLLEWSEKIQISYSTLSQRLSNGWSLMDALETPLGKRRSPG